MTLIHELDVFTREPGLGNPTGVVLNADTLPDSEMQLLATQTTLEMAFVCRPTNPAATLRLRYFSPRSEMNLCAHASIGSLWLLGELGQLAGECLVETRAGLLPASVMLADEKPEKVLFQQPLPTFDSGPFPLELVAQALGLEPGQISGPLVAASTGRAKLLIPLPDYSILDSCERNETALNQICQQYNLTGLYPYTCRSRNPVTVEARQFPYNIGFVEDPVTGVAMAALGCYLVTNNLIPITSPETRLTIEQGHAMGCPGSAEVFVRTKNGEVEQVRLGGVAVVVGQSEL
jgi:PhzF family phenazine biosynthesis protein